MSLLDVPCGRGNLLRHVTKTFPYSTTVGADIAIPADLNTRSVRIDGAHSTLSEMGEIFDVVTCVSGVMEFGNTLAFFEDVRSVIANDGLLLVTNDNLLTVRDRILYFLGGRFGQYPLDLEHETPTWQITPVQNIVRVLRDAGFKIESLSFVPVRKANWLWLPLALPLFIANRLRAKVPPAFGELRSLRSLMSRHYVLTCIPGAGKD